MKKTYNKLVRDKIPEIIDKDHQSCDIEILSDDAYLTMRVFRKIGLPKWKDRLPQFNPEFDKRHLKSGRDTAYLDRFLFITCRAEVIHYVIGVLGWVSLTFCLLSADRTAWLIRYAVIALAIQLANLPFAWIQRYNRKRLLSVRKRLSLRIEI